MRFSDGELTTDKSNANTQTVTVSKVEEMDPLGTSSDNLNIDQAATSINAEQTRDESLEQIDQKAFDSAYIEELSTAGGQATLKDFADHGLLITIEEHSFEDVHLAVLGSFVEK